MSQSARRKCETSVDVDFAAAAAVAVKGLKKNVVLIFFHVRSALPNVLELVSERMRKSESKKVIATESAAAALNKTFLFASFFIFLPLFASNFFPNFVLFYFSACCS